MEFLTQHFATIIASLFGGGSLYAYIFERKKNKAQANTLEIGNSDKVIDQYRKALDDLQVRYEQKYRELSEACDRKVKILEDEIKAHKRRYNLVKQENTDLRKRLKYAESNSSK